MERTRLHRRAASVGAGAGTDAGSGPDDWPAGLLALFAERRVELTRLAHVVTGSNAVAEDLVQEAFVRLRPVWGDVDEPAPYLRRIVLNLARGHLRHEDVVRRHAGRLPGDGDAATADPGPTGDPELDDTWAAVCRLPSRQRAVLAPGLVWTGTELIRFGGYGQARATGADAYDPATDTWRTLADLPDELAGAGIGVWTGSELVAFPVQRDGVAATYDPATDIWELLSDPAIPFIHVESFAFWTGDKVLLAGVPSSAASPSDVGNDLGGGAVLYDPVTGVWEGLPDAPTPLAANSAAVWTGREAVFVTQEPVEAGVAPPTPGVTTLALDPATATWRELPAPPLRTREVPLLAWTGTEVVMAGGVTVPDTADPDGRALRDAAALDPATGAWRPYPAPPVAVFGDDVAAQSSIATARGQVVALDTADRHRRPLILDPGAEAWQLGAPPPAGTPTRPGWAATSTGAAVLAVGDGRAFSFTPPGGR